jgi:hypothetical protein
LDNMSASALFFFFSYTSSTSHIPAKPQTSKTAHTAKYAARPEYANNISNP